MATPTLARTVTHDAIERADAELGAATARLNDAHAALGRPGASPADLARYTDALSRRDAAAARLAALREKMTAEDAEAHSFAEALKRNDSRLNGHAADLAKARDAALAALTDAEQAMAAAGNALDRYNRAVEGVGRDLHRAGLPVDVVPGGPWRQIDAPGVLARSLAGVLRAWFEDRHPVMVLLLRAATVLRLGQVGHAFARSLPELPSPSTSKGRRALAKIRRAAPPREDPLQLGTVPELVRAARERPYRETGPEESGAIPPFATDRTA